MAGFVLQHKEKFELRENVGWVVKCRVVGDVCGKMYGKICKGGKCRVGGGVCVTTQRKI